MNLSARYGGVTRRPSPSGREERSSRTRKDDETAECTPVSVRKHANTFSFAGGRGKRDLGQFEKPSTVCSQKELSLKRRCGARRGGRDSKSFAAAGWRHGGARQGIEEGSSRNARVLHSTLSARMGSRGQPRWRWESLRSPIESVRLAADGPPLRRRTSRNVGETKPREGFTLPIRARMMALEGVPVRRIWSAEVGRRQRSQRSAVPNVTRGSA